MNMNELGRPIESRLKEFRSQIKSFLTVEKLTAQSSTIALHHDPHTFNTLLAGLPRNERDLRTMKVDAPEIGYRGFALMRVAPPHGHDSSGMHALAWGIVATEPKGMFTLLKLEEYKNGERQNPSDGYYIAWRKHVSTLVPFKIETDQEGHKQLRRTYPEETNILFSELDKAAVKLTRLYPDGGSRVGKRIY